MTQAKDNKRFKYKFTYSFEVTRLCNFMSCMIIRKYFIENRTCMYALTQSYQEKAKFTFEAIKVEVLSLKIMMAVFQRCKYHPHS